jgi:hypothetical protein
MAKKGIAARANGGDSGATIHAGSLDSPDNIKRAKKRKPSAAEQIGTRTKKVRGMARESIHLIEAMYTAAEAAQPITGRGIGYKLFVAKLIPSMARAEMRRVYRLLKEARERGDIPWEWIVDETRELERRATWDDPEAYARTVSRAYRRDFWNQQPVRVEVWSEKGTVRGVLQPVLNDYQVGFRVMHGFSGATTIHDVAEDYDGRPLIVLYVGDYDPSGLNMSEHDIRNRLDKYGGDHVILKRVALTRKRAVGLPSFPATDKKDDPRFKWFVQNFGNQCWELDALDPNDLRTLVEEAIRGEIEPVAWERCDQINKAERESLRTVLAGWKGAP